LGVTAAPKLAMASSTTSLRVPDGLAWTMAAP